jgi:uncharacterized repeat protein (TIGR03803 family)
MLRWGIVMEIYYCAGRARKSFSWAGLSALCVALLVTASPRASAEPTFTVLHAFSGTDGGFASGGLVIGSAGILYGRSAASGDLVFRLAPDGTGFAVLRFLSGVDWSIPSPGLIADAAGYLFGTSLANGEHIHGTVFRLAPDGTYRLLHSFCSKPNCSDGRGPFGAPLTDPAGNLYGTTYDGGEHGFGTVFKLAPDGTYTVLHSFALASDGASPFAGLIADSAGDLYGTTFQGGRHNGGTVFKLAPDGTGFRVLHSFDSSDGANPYAGLIADASGHLYGTTHYGGGAGCGSLGCGVVFGLATDGTEFRVLHSFDFSNGARPIAGLIADAAGNLYGTTFVGSNPICVNTPVNGCGVVFKLAPDGTYTVLYSFSGGSDGYFPTAGLVADRAGNLYGTTIHGGPRCGDDGYGCGTVFKLSGTGFVTEQQVALQVTPEAGIVAKAAKGGAIFSASAFDYALGVAAGSAHVEISGIPSWLNASFTSAHVTAGSPLTASFSLANLGTLARGTYNANLTFTDTTGTHATITRTATLRVYEWRDCLNGGWQSIAAPPGPFPSQGRCVAAFGRLLSSR